MHLPQVFWRAAYGDVLRTLLTIVAVTGMFIIFLNQQSSEARQISDEQRTIKTLTHLGKQRSDQINDLQKHIDCIVELFQQPNRTNLVISDLENCQISANGMVSTSTNFGISPPKTSQALTPTPQSQSVSQPSLSSPASPPSSPQPSPSPTPLKPGLVKQVLNFLGL